MVFRSRLPYDTCTFTTPQVGAGRPPGSSGAGSPMILYLHFYHPSDRSRGDTMVFRSRLPYDTCTFTTPQVVAGGPYGFQEQAAL